MNRAMGSPTDRHTERQKETQKYISTDKQTEAKHTKIQTDRDKYKDG